MAQSLDLEGLLNRRERNAVRVLKTLYRKRFKRDPMKDANLFFSLVDNPNNRVTWSAVSGRIPTLRKASGFVWHVMSRRWLLPREILATLGFPVEQQSAAAMGVPILPIACPRRAAAVAGNCMHMSTVSVIQLVGLCCFQRIDQ